MWFELEMKGSEERGDKNRQIKTAKKLLESNVDRTIILSSTELTEEELQKIEKGEL